MKTLSPSPPPGFDGRGRGILVQESPVVPVVASTWHGPMVKPVPWGMAKQGGARGSVSQEVIMSCLTCLTLIRQGGGGLIGPPFLENAIYSIFYLGK